MCRNIKTLFNFDPPATEEEIRDASLQFVRKLSGFHHPSKINEHAFNQAVERVAKEARVLLDSLSTDAEPHNREEEARRAHLRALQRFGKTNSIKIMHVDEMIKVWQEYFHSVNDWQQLVKNLESKQTACGPVYELTNPIDRPQESFAIADMRNIKLAEPHYHRETEIYFVLQGKGLVVVGGRKQEIQKGSVVIIPSNTAHFTLPQEDLVIAVVNTPPFRTENYIVLTHSDEQVKFDKDQFDKLIKENNITA